MNQPQWKANASLNDSGFDLSDIFAFLWQKKFRIIALFSLLMVASFYYVTNLPKFYKASTTLLLNSGDASFSLPPSIASVTGGPVGQLDTHIEFIRSRQFAEIMVNKLQLHEEPEFIEDASNAETIDAAVKYFLSMLTATKLGSTDMLRVSFESRSPALSQNLVNSIGLEYFAFYTTLQQQRAGQASDFLNSQLESIQTRLSEAEFALQQYIDENQLVDVTSQLALAREEINALMQEKLQNDRQASRLQSTLRQAQLYQGNYKKLAQLPGVFNNSMVAEIKRNMLQQQEALAELSKRYKSKHHKYVAAQSRLDAVEEELNQLIGQLVNSIAEEAASLQERQKALNKRITELRDTHNNLGLQQVKLTKLQREAESTQKLYEVFLARLQETELVKDIGNKENFAVVDYAALPKDPSRPRVVTMLALMVIVSFIFSTGFWLALHLVSDSMTRFRQSLKLLNIPIVAMLPKTGAGSILNVGRLFAKEQRQEDFQYAEAIRNLRTAIVVRGDDTPLRTIALVGVKAADEKRDLSMNLAESFSRLDKTLLVDLNLREPRVAALAKINEGAPGITSFIDKKARFGACLHKKANSSLTVLPSGPTPQDPLAYISKPRFAAIVKKLGVLFDRVVIETPAVNAYSDAMVIARSVDAVILVCDIERNDVDDLVEAVQRLKEVDAPLIGVVLNKVKNLPMPIAYRSSRRGFIRRLFA